jgi:NAD(P)-dependent dehydrogenase (short-subunit alcohol dehydrogenase family)
MKSSRSNSLECPAASRSPLRWIVHILAVAALAGSTAIAQTPAPAPGPARLREGQLVALVTGSTDGLGREVARQLAEGGAYVIVHGRNRERGEALVREIEAAGKGNARFYAADLASLTEVRALAAAIQRDYTRLNVLVNNAGIWLANPPERQLSADGNEMHFAVNYLAGYALTHLLLPKVIASAPARIVNVSSSAQAPINFDDLKLEQGYNPTRAYSISKLAQVMFTFDLAERLAGAGVTVTALHPATMMDTNLARAGGVQPRSTVAEGAAAVLHLVTAPDIESGQYYNGLRPGRANAQAYDAAARSRLRAVSQALTGLPADGR